MGITSSGEFKLCSTLMWYVELETTHTKDVNCEYGCFPVDDLVVINVTDFHVELIDPVVELNGGGLEWFLETLIMLFMPVITYVTNEKVEAENKDVLPAIIQGAYDDAYKMWALQDEMKQL